MLKSLRDKISALWRRLTGKATPQDRAIIQQVLDPAFLREGLKRVQRDGTGSLSAQQYQDMYAELEAAQASPVSGADPTQGGQAYLPRSPALSVLQSTLTNCVSSRFEDLVKPLPPGHRSFAEFVLRETDIFRQFGPCDASWIESVISKGLSLLDGRSEFPQGRAPDVPLAENARIVVVGDWGTGLPGAQAVGREMEKQLREGKRAGREVHALHLGDVYYSGWKEEYESRFMPYWPVHSADEGVASWALNGNHDMYSGGHGYFGYLLRDARFQAQNGSSYFCLENQHWQLLGLDTAYLDDDLAGDQAAWVEQKLRASDRKTMLLTHHQPFSEFAPVEPPLVENLKSAFAVRRIDAWLWGHEHLCCVYERNHRPYLTFGSCVGHGGVPVLLPPGAPPAGVSWRAEGCELHQGEDRWQRFGFAVLDFHGPSIDVQYFDQNGEPEHAERIE